MVLFVELLTCFPYEGPTFCSVLAVLPSINSISCGCGPRIQLAAAPLMRILRMQTDAARLLPAVHAGLLNYLYGVADILRDKTSDRKILSVRAVVLLSVHFHREVHAGVSGALLSRAVWRLRFAASNFVGRCFSWSFLPPSISPWPCHRALTTACAIFFPYIRF